MEDILQRQNFLLHAQAVSHPSDQDKEAEDLFNQIQLNSQQPQIQSDQSELNLKNLKPNSMREPKQRKRLKKFTLELDSDQSVEHVQNGDKQINQRREPKSLKKDRKARKMQKKLRKAREKHKKNTKHKKLKKEGQGKQQINNSAQWSGESSASEAQDSDASDDSLLRNLNPKRKIESAEKKQGFFLKELGNDGQVQYKNDDGSDNSSYNGKKKKALKKQAPKNQQMLKSLLSIGLCIEEEENADKEAYDNGLQQVLNMKGSKKKGPKITNKLFLDMNIDDEDHNQAPPQKIELEVKARISSGPSAISSSFLSKAERVKKARGMESEMQQSEFDKIKSFKVKQSMSKLINKSQLGEVEDIQLDIKVPQILKGKQELNNSIFLKKIASAPPQLVGDPKQQSPLKIKSKVVSKLSRFDYFKSISEELKARKSIQMTDEAVKNSFKVTKLEQIEDMRRKNEDKRRREALRGSDEEVSIGSSQEKQEIEEKQLTQEHKLNFMNFKIQIEDVNINLDKEALSQKSENINENLKEKQNKDSPDMAMEQEINEKIDVKNEIRKTKSFNIEITKTVPNEEYIKLMKEYEGDQEGRSAEIGDESNEQVQDQNEERSVNQIDRDSEKNSKIDQRDDLDLDEEQQPAKQLNDQQIQSAERVQLEVDLEISEQPESISSLMSSIGVNKQQPNEQYEQYLNQLEEEGIKLKKHGNSRTVRALRQPERIEENNKENISIMENAERLQANNEESEARKQFRKLRKLATILKQKKAIEIRTKRAGQFFDEEAQEGSDNEEHDHQVKKIDDDDEAKEYEGLDMDAQLEQLIDNAVNINEEDEELAFRKYMEDVKIQDREELKRIMKGDFKRNKDVEPLMDEMEEDERKRIQRMEQFQQYIKQKEIEDGKDMYMDDENESQNIHNDNSNDLDSNELSSNENRGAFKEKQAKNAMAENGEEFEVVDEINEQNLKRYLDEGVADSFITKTIIRKAKVELPESYQRSKKTVMRNGMKAKDSNLEPAPKIKKTSHLNEMIMRSKKPIKPLILSKSLQSLSMRK